MLSEKISSLLDEANPNGMGTIGSFGSDEPGGRKREAEPQRGSSSTGSNLARGSLGMLHLPRSVVTSVRASMCVSDGG